MTEGTPTTPADPKLSDPTFLRSWADLMSERFGDVVLWQRDGRDPSADAVAIARAREEGRRAARELYT